jgi:hypothetical protein
MLTENEQDLILKELDRVFHGTPKGELPHLRSFRLEGTALMCVCAVQESGQWLTRAIDNLRLGSGARLKANGCQESPQSLSRCLSG